jgi:hypothetical protein
MVWATQTRNEAQSINTNVVPILWNIVFIVIFISLSIFFINIIFRAVRRKLGFFEAVWILESQQLS